MDHNSVTNAHEIDLPIEVVELKHLKTKSGEPVRVLCGGVDELVLQRITKTLPGAHVPKMLDGDLPSQTDEQVINMVEGIKAIAPLLLESGTAFSDGNGGEVRPAFYWDATKAVSGSINGRLLRIEDLNELVTAILRAGGYLPAARGQQAEIDFPS